MEIKTSLPHDHGKYHPDRIRQILAGSRKFHEASELFRMLDDESRVKIFWLLCHTEECVVNIAAIMNMSGPAVSHHLQLLKVAGLVESRKDGKETFYQAADTELAELLHQTLESVMKLVCPADEPEKARARKNS